MHFCSKKGWTKSALITLFLLSSLLPGIVLAGIVDASQYERFWLWAGVKPQPVLSQAKTLYLLQGEVTRQHGNTLFLRQGYPISKLSIPELWLVYRVSSLEWNPTIERQILNNYQGWRRQGNQVQGIQIDFDAGSHQLEQYSHFLRVFRQRLPDDCRLSVTGLLDWAKTGDVQQLNRLQGVIDEIIIQSYQGRHTVSSYDDYLPALKHLTVPFKIGLVQHGEWDSRWETKLSAQPNYQGVVVFLLNSTQS